MLLHWSLNFEIYALIGNLNDNNHILNRANQETLGPNEYTNDDDKWKDVRKI